MISADAATLPIHSACGEALAILTELAPDVDLALPQDFFDILNELATESTKHKVLNWKKKWKKGCMRRKRTLLLGEDKIC